MPNPITLTRPTGLHILTSATLAQLAADEALLKFAGGLLPIALSQTELPGDITLATLLHQTSTPQIYPVWVALLALDAELSAIVDDKQRVFPLSAFLSYQTHLPPDKLSFNLLRLPPLNPDGHYHLTIAENGYCFAVRLDLHPRLKVTGHVRLALSSPTRFPIRLEAAEHRLNRQILSPTLIDTAIIAGSKALSVPLTDAEMAGLVEGLLKTGEG